MASHWKEVTQQARLPRLAFSNGLRALAGRSLNRHTVRRGRQPLQRSSGPSKAEARSSCRGDASPAPGSAWSAWRPAVTLESPKSPLQGPYGAAALTPAQAAWAAAADPTAAGASTSAAGWAAGRTGRSPGDEPVAAAPRVPLHWRLMRRTEQAMTAARSTALDALPAAVALSSSLAACRGPCPACAVCDSGFHSGNPSSRGPASLLGLLQRGPSFRVLLRFASFLVPLTGRHDARRKEHAAGRVAHKQPRRTRAAWRACWPLLYSTYMHQCATLQMGVACPRRQAAELCLRGAWPRTVARYSTWLHHLGGAAAMDDLAALPGPALMHEPCMTTPCSGLRLRAWPICSMAH